MPFEEAIGRLEAIAHRLEDPETPLEDMLALYEEGVGIARRCAALLEAAELKVEHLRAAPSGGEESSDAV